MNTIPNLYQPEIKINLADQSHIEALVGIISSTFHLSCPKESSRDLQAIYITKHFSKDTFSRLVASEHSVVWVALDNTQPITLAALEKKTNASAVLSKLYVLPEYHGLGIATMLCNALLKQAKHSGFKTLRLYVYSGNWKAIAFYEKLGFTFLKEVDFFMETEVHTDHIYELHV